MFCGHDRTIAYSDTPTDFRIPGQTPLDGKEASCPMTDSGTGPEKRLQRIFERFDRNGDGRIDEAEFGAILDDLRWESPAEIRSLEFAAIDGNEDGLVEFDEFARWWLDQN